MAAVIYVYLQNSKPVVHFPLVNLGENVVLVPMCRVEKVKS